MKMENKKLNYLFLGLLIGSISGVLLTLYRKLISQFQKYFVLFYEFGRKNLFYGFIVIISISLLGLIVGILSYKEPMIGGSGIPQVMGQLKNKFKIKWAKVLSFKFIGGLIALSTGLTVGREGPSVQMGASIGQAFGSMKNKSEEDKKILITAGAASGLSAAFNAPISGILFVLEELHHNFNKYIFIAATASTIAADYISGLVLGTNPVIKIENIVPVPNKIFPALIILGIVIGLLSPIFSKSIYLCKSMYKKLPIPKYLKIVFPFFITAIIILLMPETFGSGEHFIFLPNLDKNFTILQILSIGLIKFALLVLAFSSGMPGGIFLPILVFGSLIGNAYGQILSGIGLISTEQIIFLSTVSMCANFAAIVRSPLTAIMLLIELTGSFTYFLPIAVVVLSTYITVELMNLKPIYTGLLEILEKETNC